MLKEIKEFYEKTKLKEKIKDKIEDNIAYNHIFYKEYPRLQQIELSEAKRDGELEHLLENRMSVRTFSDTPLALEDLSKLLNSCRVTNSDDGFERRSYPSAGARYPVEMYVMAFNVKGLDNGAYHYNIRRNRLELLLRKDFGDIKEEVVSPFLNNPAAAVVFTSVVPRAEIKYGCKAYPYSLIEAGHMGQNIALTGIKHGIGSCSIGGFVNDTVSRLLDLTQEEIPLYVIGVGKQNDKT